MEQEQIIAATTVLEIALRDILREDLGQTYTVSVGLSQPLPQRGAGHIEVSFGAAPENIATMTARVMQEIKRLQQEGPSAGSDQPRQGNGAARLRDGAAGRTTTGWGGCRRSRCTAATRRDPDAQQAHRRADAAGAAGRVQEVLPGGPLDRGDARPLSRAVTARAPLRRCPAFVTKRLCTTYPTGVRPLIDTRTGAL